MDSTMIKGTIAGLALALLAPGAMAVPLLPGNSVLLPGTTAAARPELAGTIVFDDVDTQLNVLNQLTFAGYSYQNRVVRSDVTNTAIISPRLRDSFNVSFNDLFLDGFSVTGYAGWATDVDYRTDTLGDRGPTFVERSADGDVLTFTFGFPLISGNLFAEPHEESFFIDILTDAPSFALTGTATLDHRNLSWPGGGFTTQYTGIAVPSAAGAIPAVAPLSLLVAGLGGLLMAACRRGTQHSI